MTAPAVICDYPRTTGRPKGPDMLAAIRHTSAPLRRLLLDAAEVPADLGSVTSIATAEEHDPGAGGHDARWRRGDLASGGACLCHRHAPGSFAGRAPARPRRAEARDRSCARQRARRPRRDARADDSGDASLRLLGQQGDGRDAVAPAVGAQGAEPARSGQPLPAGVRPQRQARHHDLPAAVPQGRDPDDPDQRRRRRGTAARSPGDPAADLRNCARQARPPSRLPRAD